MEPKFKSLMQIGILVENLEEAVKNYEAMGISGWDISALDNTVPPFEDLKFDGKEIPEKGQFGHDGQFGHEMVGIVHEVGEDVKDINVGDRVFVNPAVAKRNGMMGCDIAGAFSEYMVVEDAKYGYNLFRLSDDTTFDEAVVIEPLAVATHAKNRIDVKASDNVLIFGAGTIGLCALNAVLASGCRNPIVVDMNEKRLEMVEKMGGIGYCPARDGEILPFLKSKLGAVYTQFGQERANIDAYIDCAGAAPILPEIMGMAKEHSRVVIVAVYKKPAELNAANLLSAEITVKGSCGYEHSDIVEAFNNIDTHRTKTPEIVTHHFKHEDAEKAFEFAADPAAGGIKIVIDYE